MQASDGRPPASAIGAIHGGREKAPEISSDPARNNLLSRLIQARLGHSQQLVPGKRPSSDDQVHGHHLERRHTSDALAQKSGKDLPHKQRDDGTHGEVEIQTAAHTIETGGGVPQLGGGGEATIGGGGDNEFLLRRRFRKRVCTTSPVVSGDEIETVGTPIKRPRLQERKVPKTKFYAVKGGAASGIYTSWEGERQAKWATQQKGAKVKSFPNEEDAISFLGGKDVYAHFEPAHCPPHSIVVYLDGSYDPKNDAVGWAVWFGKDSSHNVCGGNIAAECWPHACSNQRAELMAAVLAVEFSARYRCALHCMTDSTYVLKWSSSYGQVNALNGFPKSVPHWDLGKRLVEGLGRPEVVCSFEKVPAHRGVFGNEQADLLAKKGASDAFRKAMREL